MTTVYRPSLDVIQTGGSITIVDGDGNVQQIIGTQPDGTVGISHQNGAPPTAPSTPVVTDATLGLTVTWDGLLAGDMAGDAMNQNTDFEAGLDPWIVPAEVTAAQSSTEAHGGTSSAQITPNGSATAASLQSEFIAGITPGASYQAVCWAWLTDAVTDDFSLSVYWYDTDSQLLSVDDTWIDLPAATWSEVLHTLTAPTGAAFAQLVPTLGNSAVDTDPIAQVFYIDDVDLAPVTLDTPVDFDHVAVHVSETSGFTPDSTTLAGTLTHAGSFPVSPLTGGTEYFVVLVGVNTSGIAGDPSAQASGTPSEVVATSILDGIVTTVKLADDAVTQAKIDAAAVGTTEIADDAITTPKIIAGAVEAGQLAAGSVVAGKIAADAVTTANLQALAVTAAKIAANTITAGQLAAGSISADKLAAVIALVTTLICGDPAGQRVQIDDTGINQYDANGNNMVMMAGGNAIFRGGSVSASEIDTTNMVINAGDNGSLLMYGLVGTALNSNPDMVSGIAGWTGFSGSQATTISYSSTHTFNGHNTLRMVAGQPSGGVASTAVTGLTPGNAYTFDALALLSDNTTTVTPIILWLDSGGSGIGSHVVGSTIGGTQAGNWKSGSATGIAPTGAVEAELQFLFNSTTAGAAYIAHAALSGPGLAASLSPVAGIDQYGNTYPAGLNADGLDVNLGPVCRLITTSTKGLPSKANYVASWDTADYDTVSGGGSWSPSAPTRFVCTKAGIYHFVGTANMLAFGARLIINFQKNGTTLNGRSFGWSGASRTTSQFSRQIKLAVSDYVEMVIFNDAAADSTMPAGSGDQPSLDVTYLHG